MELTGFTLAKALHILGVTLWIGGVAFVTFILLPAIRNSKKIENKYEMFELIEHRFAFQARLTTLITGLSGFYLVWDLDAWDRFLYLEYYWMHLMVLVWLLFTLMLFVIEPIFLDKFFREWAKKDPVGLMKRVYKLHIFLITLSIFTIFTAMINTH